MANAGQAQYIKPVILRLARDTRHALYVASDRDFGLSLASVAAEFGLPVGRILDRDEVAALYPIDIFVSPSQWALPPPSTRISICMFHGQPSKGNTFVPELIGCFDVLFLLGPMQKGLYEDFAKGHPNVAKHISTKEVGYPKSDQLLGKKIKSDEAGAKLAFREAGPVVLFAPAFDAGTSLELYGEKILEHLLHAQVNVAVKLHPMHYDLKFQRQAGDWPARLKHFEETGRVRVLGNEPLDSYMAAAAIMLTDVSGAAFEFMMLDKPVVFIDCPKFFETTLGQGNYVRSGTEVIHDIRANAGRSAGVVVRNLEELPAAILRCVERPEEYSAQRNAIRAELLFNPGEATEVATRLIEEML